jgi:hypothetical protein
MAYPQFDDFVDKERALLLWGGGSSAASAVIEQRKHRRVAWRAQITANELPNDSVFPKFKMAGEVLNIGAGGVCIISDVPLDAATVLQCDMKLPGVDVRIPTVMQVAWVAITDGDKYVWGLRYVI